MDLTMDDLLSPGFITAYILGFIFLILIARFLCESFSEYLEKFIRPMLLLLGVLTLGIIICYVTYRHYNNQQVLDHFDIKETIKGNH